jgi:hypothetical protein
MAFRPFLVVRHDWVGVRKNPHPLLRLSEGAVKGAFQSRVPL